MQSTRRLALPLRVHQIWDSIGRASLGNELPADLERLIQSFSTVHKLPRDEMYRELELALNDQVVRELKLAIRDRLVVSEVIQTQKREEIEVYKLPDPEFSKGDHDWYCFNCHMGGGGPIVACEDCPRIFHLDCLPDDGKPEKYSLFICPSCHIMTTMPSAESLNINQKQLNALLQYSCTRFKDWLVSYMNSSDGGTWAVASSRDAKEGWKYDYLVYFHIDLTQMLEKASSGKYTSLEEYQVDCETLIHGIGVYFGNSHLKSQTVPAAFYSGVINDIQEIKLCHDCFRRFNEKDPAWWFCIPCTTPHEVVWAKRPGHSYWPVKVMKVEGSKYDVRYFGGNYERGMIDVMDIRPFGTTLKSMSVRRTAAWKEAYDELNKFQRIAKDPESVSTLLQTTKGGNSCRPEKGNVSLKSRGTLQVSEADPCDNRQVIDAEDFSFLNTLQEVCVADSLSGDPYFSDKKQHESHKSVSEDAVSSSVSESSVSRKVYVQTSSRGLSGRQDIIKECVVKHLTSIRQRHAQEISSIKKKLWCFICEREAIYHCCLNTGYCSLDCQHVHWAKEHRRRCCRRNATR